MTDMARHVRTTIRYDGPALVGHEMDVQDLAPALLALADIIQIANKKFNGDQAAMRVLVNADVEQKCFMIDLSLVQSIMDQAKTFFGQDNVKTAKEIAEWIGIIGAGSGGLFALLKIARKRGASETKLEVKPVPGTTNVSVTGNGNTIIIPAQAYQLAQEPTVVEKAKAVMKPLQKDGYETLSFLEGEREVVEVDKTEAREIIATSLDALDEPPTESVAHIRGPVRIKSPQYEGSAKWSLLWNGRAIDADMVGDALQWVADFQANRVAAPPNSVLDVSMTETVKLNDAGEAAGRPTYAVSEIHSVTPPPQQLAIGL